MSTTTNATMDELIETLHHLLSIDAIRERCDALGDYYRLQRTQQRRLEQQEAAIAEKEARIAAKDALLAAMEDQIAAKDALIKKNQYIIRIHQLYLLLIQDNRQEDLERAFRDPAFRETLLEEYHL